MSNFGASLASAVLIIPIEMLFIAVALFSLVASALTIAWAFYSPILTFQRRPTIVKLSPRAMVRVVSVKWARSKSAVAVYLMSVTTRFVLLVFVTSALGAVNGILMGAVVISSLAYPEGAVVTELTVGVFALGGVVVCASLSVLYILRLRRHSWSWVTTSASAIELPRSRFSTRDVLRISRSLCLYGALEVLLPLCFIIAGLLFLVPALVKPERLIVVLIAMVLLQFPVNLAIIALKHLVDRAMSSTSLAVEIRRCLTAGAGQVERPGGKVRRPDLSARLERVAFLLARFGSRSDGRWVRRAQATIAFAVAAKLRELLESDRWLDTRLPPELASVLGESIYLVLGSTSAEMLHKLKSATNAFVARGHPDSDVRSGWTRNKKLRFGELLDRSSKMAGSVWALFTLVLVVVLLFEGKLDLSKIQLQR